MDMTAGGDAGTDFDKDGATAAGRGRTRSTVEGNLQ